MRPMYLAILLGLAACNVNAPISIETGGAETEDDKAAETTPEPERPLLPEGCAPQCPADLMTPLEALEADDGVTYIVNNVPPSKTASDNLDDVASIRLYRDSGRYGGIRVLMTNSDVFGVLWDQYPGHDIVEIQALRNVNADMFWFRIVRTEWVSDRTLEVELCLTTNPMPFANKCKTLSKAF